jgi:hypothetical protein
MPPLLPQLYQRVVNRRLLRLEPEGRILLSVRLRRCQVMFLERDCAQVALALRVELGPETACQTCNQGAIQGQVACYQETIDFRVLGCTG